MFRRASLEEIYRNVDIIGLLLLLLLEAAFEPQLVRGGKEGAVMPGRVDMIFYLIYFLWKCECVWERERKRIWDLKRRGGNSKKIFFEKIEDRKEKGYG